VTPRYHVRYHSTRGQNGKLVSFAEALLSGLAPDGGLYVPDAVPAIAPELWRKAPSLAKLGQAVLGRWLGGEIEGEALGEILADALDFPIPVVKLENDLFVLELFHGPTLSFKDVAARTMARLMNHLLGARRERVTILVATSGDTGSAVVEGFSGQANIEVVLLYPQGKVSPVQERQLIVRRAGVRALAVKGSFDDCQRLVKAAFTDPELSRLSLSSANSINIGRLLPQSLYYFWAAKESGLDRPNFCVPSGNLGNLTGGVLAHLMGLPVGKFIAAHNANDFFPRYLKGLAEGFKPSIATLSNAMDVGAPSNFERLGALVSEETLTAKVWGTSVSDKSTRERMKRTYETLGYLADPHTAVGLEAASRYREETGDETPLIVLATAHPAKFPEVAKVLGIPTPKVERLERLWQEPVQVEALEPSLTALREVLLTSMRA
jgi:threonine synthase